MGKYIVIVALVAGVAAASGTFSGCNTTPNTDTTTQIQETTQNTDGIIIRKSEADGVHTICVQYSVDGLNTTIDYRVTQNYYDSIKIGDKFVYDESNMVGDGLDEFEVR